MAFNVYMLCLLLRSGISWVCWDYWSAAVPLVGKHLQGVNWLHVKSECLIFCFYMC